MSRRTNKQNKMGSMPNVPPQPTTVNVDLSVADDITCDSCGNYTFLPVVLMKRLSALLSPTGQEAIVPMQVFSCNACGWVNNEFLPTKQNEETNAVLTR